MPAEDPAFVALVMVDDPQTTKHYYGAEVSAPVFANIAKQVAQIMNIPPDLPAPAAARAGSEFQLQPRRTVKLSEILKEVETKSDPGAGRPR